MFEIITGGGAFAGTGHRLARHGCAGACSDGGRFAANRSLTKPFALAGHPVGFSLRFLCLLLCCPVGLLLDSSIGPERVPVGLARCLAEPECSTAPTCVGGVINYAKVKRVPGRRAPVFSKAAVSPLPTLNSRRPRDLTAQSRGVRRQYGYTPHPERGVDATVTAPDERRLICSPSCRE